MANGTANVTGDLKSVIALNDELGTVEIALCGYGSYLPRQNNAGLVARPTSTPAQVPVDAEGHFSCSVTGNDVIEPAGTYYTVTIKDANGDVVQCAAYLFLADANYDLNAINPYDPTQPPPPLPPLIISQLLLIAFSSTPVFPGDQYTAWGFTLTGDVYSSSTTNTVAGNLYTFIISQNSAGGWGFVWPPNVFNAATVNPEANGITVQTFVAIADNGPMLPIGPGTYYPS